MKININKTQQITKINNISFAKLKEIKYSKDFNPKTDKDDEMALNAFNHSEPIKHLCEKFDVYAEFSKIHYSDTDTTSTILHITAKPIQKKLFSLTQKIKNHFFNNNKTMWLEGETNHKTGKITTLHKKIKNLTIAEINKKFYYTQD